MRSLPLSTTFVLMALSACGASSASSDVAAAPVQNTSIDDGPATRAVLDALVRVDTSHGGETRLLEPVAQRFREAGVPVEIVESAPGRGNLVARIKGTGAKRPLLLLAHVDVVPTEGQPWSTPPFVPTEKEGYVCGRGINDDKSMAASILVVALELAKSGAKPSRDVIVALTAGEETGGDAGVRWLVEHRRALIDAEIALNEGAGTFLAPDAQRVDVAYVGVAEKTYQSFRLTVQGKGGHSAVPPPGEGAVTRLARALVKVGEHTFPARVLPATRGQLATAARYEKGPLADALRHASAAPPGPLAPDDERVILGDRVYGALVHTTCVATMLSAAPQDNVLPTKAEAVVNCRIMPDETVDGTRAELVRVIGDPEVGVTPSVTFGWGPSEALEGEGPAAFRAAAARVFPGAAVVGSMTPGGTDSRHLRSIGIHAFGMSTSPALLADVRAGKTAHGPDECRLARWIGPGTRYLREIVRELTK